LALFLLSPAWCGGRRATMLMRPGATHALAQRLESGTLTLGEAFAFMSGLYFRGKLAYATRFADSGRQSTFVITPTRGLQPPSLVVSRALIDEFAGVDVSQEDERYRRPLLADARRLEASVPAEDRIVLLGSVATAKYLDVLAEVFGDRLSFPSEFVGRGDMSRGALMLRAAAAGAELEYVALTADTRRHGPRPPKLTPVL
jgi:hypothetical protein